MPRVTVHIDFGRSYHPIRELGRGGMATVWVADDPKHHRQVAIKVLDELGRALGTDRFLREIEIAAKLQHPHIVPLFDSGVCAVDGVEVPFYVMPYVAGESLRARLAREPRQPIDATLRLAREVAGALDHAHRHGVIHRDIKPENILLADGHALVADFGIARAVRLASAAHSTQTSVMLGTLAYMSPEQVVGNAELGPAADVYALACVLYEMLAGALPYEGTPESQLYQRFIASPRPVRELRGDFPGAIDQAILRALAREPEGRYPSAGEFASALETTGATVMPALRELSIAVLPLDNLSPNEESGYFADGLTEELIHDLSQVRSLRVTSRNSAVAARQKTRDIREIGRLLGVRYVLEGSVRQAGTDLRITAQLIEAPGDAHVWAGKYAGSLDDVFGVQEELSRTIVRALEIALRTGAWGDARSRTRARSSATCGRDRRFSVSHRRPSIAHGDWFSRGSPSEARTTSCWRCSATSAGTSSTSTSRPTGRC